jgi:hypothetical protein
LIIDSPRWSEFWKRCVCYTMLNEMLCSVQSCWLHGAIQCLQPC